MSDQQLTALLVVYPNRSYAMNAVTYLTRLEKSDLVHTQEIAVVSKDLEAKITIEEIGHASAGQGAKRGAVIGDAIGLMFPVGLVGASVAGTAIGGLTGRLRGRSQAHDGLRAMGEKLDRGHSGIILVLEDDAVEEIVHKLTGFESLHQQRVDPGSLALFSGPSEESSSASE